MLLLVGDNVVEPPKVLKKKMQREGVFREMKLHGHYEKPSEAEFGRRRRPSAAPAIGRRERGRGRRRRGWPGGCRGGREEGGPRASPALETGVHAEQEQPLLRQGVTPKPELARVAAPSPSPKATGAAF